MIKDIPELSSGPSDYYTARKKGKDNHFEMMRDQFENFDQKFPARNLYEEDLF